MTDEQIALARRAVACRGWRWMPGMRAFRDARYWQGVSDVRIPDAMHDGGYPGFFPDLTDHATLGCLLALVREAMGDQNICVCWDFVNEMWVCEGAFEYNGNKYLGLIKEAQSYAEALVLTLEDASCGQ